MSDKDQFSTFIYNRLQECRTNRRAYEIWLSRLNPWNIETGTFEVADDLLTASKRLSARVPDAQTWFVRIGHSAIDHFGARSLRTKP
jgi:hypothetical protein